MLLNDSAIDDVPVDDVVQPFNFGFTTIASDALEFYDSRKLIAWVVTATDALTLFDEKLASYFSGGGPAIITKVMTDTLTLVEEILKVLRRRRESIETMILDDEQARQISVLMNDFGIDVTDEDIFRAIRVRQQTDTLTLADGFISWRRLKRSADDTLDLLDQFSKIVSGSGTVYTRVMSEAVEFSDGFVRWLRYRRTADDPLDVLDAFSKLLSGAGITYARVMSDDITIIDDIGNRWTFRRSLTTDTLVLTDSQISGAIRNRVLGDAIAATDAFTKWMRLVRQFGTDIEFDDGIITIRNLRRVYEDDLDLTDDKIQRLFLDSPATTEFVHAFGGVPFLFRAARNIYDFGVN